MKKSAQHPISEVSNPNSNYNSSKFSAADEEQPLNFMPNINVHLNDPFGRMEKHEDESDKKAREISRLFSRLKGNLTGLEEEYK